ncbi:MAG: lipoate--protein ligase family protein, partial [Candidatus Omnitrophota bacterium]|nr:lipoate--protein ligase family protein [Candidatus Omnitrophota bacterium]
MILKDISFPSPQENILFDEVLLALAEKGGTDEILRFWESPSYFVVLGRISKPQDDLNIAEVARHQIPVVRRSSGGGTVLQGKGCLNYSLILSKDKNPQLADLKKSYQVILQQIITAFKKLDVEAQYFPISDIAIAHTQKKFSGNAQKRAKHFILHHGTILYAFDLNLIER